jgi:glyoxylase-like metal-dependent hydrolase (beta-lactamase superfamily II)
MFLLTLSNCRRNILQGIDDYNKLIMKEQIIQPKEKHALYFDVAPNVWGTKDVFVNMYMVKDEETGNWVLIDTGLKSSAAKLKKMAAELFGEDSKPSAILLTHGHFDHIGSLARLAEDWHVPIYCHYLELPYLSGRSSYPPPDSTVNGGLMAKMAWMFPKKPINIEGRLHILPPDGSVPFLNDWQYIYTPGHAPGHVSFFRRKDRVLIAGDAVVTTIQESVMSVMTQHKKLTGPPKYFTYDWEAARNSVISISDLKPEVIAAGHGKPMSGPEMKATLHNLARHFDEIALPKKGRYVDDPAVVDASGVMYVPPKSKNFPWLMLGVGLTVAATIAAAIYLSGKKEKKVKAIPLLDDFNDLNFIKKQIDLLNFKKLMKAMS